MIHMTETETTTITILRKTHARLAQLGKKGDSFDVIITRLLDQKTINRKGGENDF